MSDTNRTRYYLDDLHIGQRFISASVTITAEDIKTFAAAYDPQPFHLDEDAAAGTLFGGLAASGWHTAALTMRLLVTGDEGIEGGMIGASVEVIWPMPTRPGDTLRVVSEVKAITPSRSGRNRGMVALESRTLNQDGEAVQIMTATLVAPRRPDAATDPEATRSPDAARPGS